MTKKRKINVLVVDDEERFRKTATATLKKRGFEAVAVAGGAEALEHLGKGEVDVIVLDIKMPGMDGHEALRKMKMLRPDLEVIMLTGHATFQSALQSCRELVYAYLAKPLDIDLLADTIRDAFAKKKGPMESSSWNTVRTEN